jgi:HEAT repeat protein
MSGNSHLLSRHEVARRFLTAHLVPWMVFLLLAGCAQSPERATVKKANALLDEGRVHAALDMVDEYLRQHPDSAPLLRMRVVLLLRAADIDSAAVALQKVPAGEPIIAEMLRHRDRMVRENAAKFVSEQPNASDFRALVRATDDSDPTVRADSAHALGRLGNRAALKPLFRLLSDDNWLVRAEAASALGRMGDPHAVSWLVQLLTDADDYTRYNVTTALHDLAGESSHSVLRSAFESGGPTQQLAIAVVLAKLHDPVALAPLARAVQDKDAGVRRLVAQALGECGLAAGTNALEVLLRDPDPTVRERAQAALRQITSGGKQ